MKTITYEDFVSFNPCWLTNGEIMIKHAVQLARYRAMRDEWTALDILRLDDVSAQDRLWLVLREELIDAPVLHEFACRCAERALSRVGNPDERSIAAIEAKRKWLRRECSDDDLAAESAAARAESAAARAESAAARAASAAARAESAAARAASAAARAAECAAARAAECAAECAAARAAECAAERAAALAGERDLQVAELVRMLEEQE